MKEIDRGGHTGGGSRAQGGKPGERGAWGGRTKKRRRNRGGGVMEGEVTEDECLKAIQTLKTGKAVGGRQSGKWNDNRRGGG